MRAVYYSIDGYEFSDKEECENHETEIFNLLNGVLFFDEDFNRMSPDEFDYSIINLYNNCAYIDITDKKFIVPFKDTICVRQMFPTEGIYIFDDNTLNFININEKINDLSKELMFYKEAENTIVKCEKLLKKA